MATTASNEFILKAKKRFSEFEKYYKTLSRKNRHVAISDDVITWQMVTGDNEIVSKSINIKTKSIEYLYLQENNASEYYTEIQDKS